MYVRLSTIRLQARAQDGGDAEQSVRVLIDQPGCRGAWELFEEGHDTVSV